MGRMKLHRPRSPTLAAVLAGVARLAALTADRMEFQDNRQFNGNAGSVKSQGALGVASSERGRGAARDLSALSI